ncbi:organic solute transporter subunit alpha-like [Asterias amurensis]|uniref:organic solute transporter subunit alpha-like n=1 Tax=Asterias amurensis TaxID=7602 RepID=UPI003AB5E1AE
MYDDVIMFNCTSDPTAEELFEYFEYNPGGLACVILATVITVIQTIVMIDGIVWITKNIPHSERASSMIWIYSLWPVFCIVSLFGLYLPRAALLSNAAANLFLFPTIYHYLNLIVDYFGGEDAMIGKMKDFPVKYNRAPCFCCCCCVPEKLYTHVLKKKHFVKLEVLVMQIALIRPFLLLLSQIFIIDGTFPNDNALDYTQPGLWIIILTIASTLTAMQVISTLHNATKPRLKAMHYSTIPKYLVVQFALLMTNLQNAFLAFAMAAIECGNPFPYKSRVDVWNCFLVIIWSLVFQPICVKYMRTLKGNVLYIPHQLKSSESYSVISLAEATGEATEDMNENAPLVTGRLRSTGDSNVVDNISYGSVITV